MAIPATNHIDMAGFQLLNLKLQVLAADPSGLVAADEGRVWYNSANDQIRYWDGAAVQNLGLSGAGGPPSGGAGGDLAGSTYPNPVIANNAVTLAKMATGSVDSSKIVDGTITNADISGTAAIAKSKLAALGIVDADIAGGAAIAKSKLAALAIADADVAAGAAIAKTKLAALNIVNADIAGGAAIALSKLATDPLARANHTGTQTASTISDFGAAADARVAAVVGVRNAVNGFAGLDAQGLLPAGLLPALAITNTYVVASQAAMLALTAEPGDVAIRTDIGQSFILQGGDPTVLGNWQALVSPTDGVQSVTGAGAVASTGGINPQISLVNGGVTSAMIADGTIVNGDIADATITGGKIANLAVATVNIADLAVATAKIADGAVTTAKIADGTILGTDIAALAIATGNLADGAVTSAKIATGTIVDADISGAAAIAVSKVAGAVRKFGASVGDGAAVTYNVVHNLGSTDVHIACVRLSDGAVTLADAKVVDANTVNVTFGAPPANNAYRIIVLG